MFKIFQIIWLFLPAILANMSPVIFQRINFLNYSLDFNLKLKKNRILGSHKTWRGLFFGILIAILTVFFQSLFDIFAYKISLINYSQINFIILGFLFGFGALGGDALKSFFKRRFNIACGVSWPPFDQIDWIIGSYILINFYISLPMMYLLIALVFLGSGHVVINYIFHSLKTQIKDIK